MNNEITNGCTNPKTFTLIERFKRSPHIMGWMMFPEEEESEEEIVSVTFQHYLQTMVVDFNVETELGEVIVLDPNNMDDIDAGHMIGLISVDKLEDLLSKLPHIDNYLEDEGIGETLH